ncbi:MAG: DNA recombination protein RmuC [Candidatus Electrothrix sp. AX2]|nr:DNA recombination protein RmuC [Candidatus Electrothrix gigas]MCI5227215.1 DNA recombination protein RmuC [Candidatus Electrothrix gigas]
MAADNFFALIGLLHFPSLIIGIGLTVLSMLSLLLVVTNRLQRENMLLALQLQQSSEDAYFFEQETKKLRQEQEQLRQQKEEVERDNIGLEAFLHETRAIAGERQQFLIQSKQQLENEFYNLSRKVMAEQGRVLQEQHAGGLDHLLSPVWHQLDTFRQKVEDMYERESRDRLSLLHQVEHLKELNEQLSQEAVELTQLTKSLQGTNKLQGQWGEMVLERLLEESGLRPGTEFATQVALRDEQGRLKKPDVIVYLPEKRAVIIDAKMSLNSYLAAGQTDNKQEQEQHLRNHIKSIQQHVNGLSKKQYQQLPELTTLDFVLLFIPVEGAFQAAVSNKPALLTQSLRRRVMIASPSTLLAILRTIHHIWRMDEQNRNSMVIAQEAGKLYDKFVGFVEAFDEVGNRLHQAQKSWQVAEKRLSTGKGNLIDRAEALRELGVQPSKDLKKNG